jgi:hypothetical protein
MGLLFPYPALHGLELVVCHSVSGREVSCEGLSSTLRRSARQERRMVLPAVILASISTLESAGIQDSGSSTRS